MQYTLYRATADLRLVDVKNDWTWRTVVACGMAWWAAWCDVPWGDVWRGTILETCCSVVGVTCDGVTSSCQDMKGHSVWGDVTSLDVSYVTGRMMWLVMTQYVCVCVCLYVRTYATSISPQGLGLAAEHGSFFRWPDDDMNDAAQDRYDTVWTVLQLIYVNLIYEIRRRFWGKFWNLIGPGSRYKDINALHFDMWKNCCDWDFSEL